MMYRPCYAEKPKSNRPTFQKGSMGGMPLLNTRKVIILRLCPGVWHRVCT